LGTGVQGHRLTILRYCWQDVIPATHALVDPKRSAYTTLTVLTRLAQRKSEAEGWLRSAFHDRLDALAESALDVATETGDPIGLVLAREIEENADEDLAGRLMDWCAEARYLSSVPLLEVHLAATRKKGEFFAVRHSPSSGLSNDVLEAVESERAHLANSLSTRLNTLGRREEAISAIY